MYCVAAAITIATGGVPIASTAVNALLLLDCSRSLALYYKCTLLSAMRVPRYSVRAAVVLQVHTAASLTLCTHSTVHMLSLPTTECLPRQQGACGNGW
jgi:hypothetical protein